MTRLESLDLLLTLLHLIVIGFNLFGWIWPRARRLHLISILLTAGFWTLPGIWYGFGYCPLTDWQWQVKEQLGETQLPDSFIKYAADKLSGKDISSSLVDTLTAVFFLAAAFLSVYLNFMSSYKRKERRRRTL